MKPLDTDFAVVANALNVTHIANPIIFFASPDDLLEVVWEGFMESFSESWFCIVRKDNKIYGYLAYDDDAFTSPIEGFVGEVMKPLTIELIVSSSLHLLELVSLFTKQYFLFVLEGNEITQVVSFQDLDKPAVKLSIFSYLLELEGLLLDLYSANEKIDELIKQYVPQKHLQKAKELLKAKKVRETPYNLLSCTSFRDKINIIKHDPEVCDRILVQDKAFFDLVVKVRNKIAHGESILTILCDPKQFSEFINELLSINQAIRTFIGHSVNHKERTNSSQ